MSNETTVRYFQSDKMQKLWDSNMDHLDSTQQWQAYKHILKLCTWKARMKKLGIPKYGILSMFLFPSQRKIDD